MLYSFFIDVKDMNLGGCLTQESLVLRFDATVIDGGVECKLETTSELSLETLKTTFAPIESCFMKWKEDLKKNFSDNYHEHIDALFTKFFEENNFDSHSEKS